MGTGAPEKEKQRQRESKESARGNPGEGAGPGAHPAEGGGAGRGLSASPRPRAARRTPQVSASPTPRGSAQAGGRGRFTPSWSQANTSVFVFFAAPGSGLPLTRPDGPGGTAHRAVPRGQTARGRKEQPRKMEPPLAHPSRPKPLGSGEKELLPRPPPPPHSCHRAVGLSVGKAALFLPGELWWAGG